MTGSHRQSAKAPFLFWIACLIPVTPTHGQEAAIRVDVSLVTLGVRVTDGKGREVPDLTAADFRISEDGVLQPIAFFSKEEQAISLGVILDKSGSMNESGKLERAKAAALSLSFEGRKARLNRAYDRLREAGLLASNDEAQYDRARNEQRPVEVYIGLIDNRSVGGPVTRGRISVRDVNGVRVAPQALYTRNQPGPKNSISIELPVGAVNITIELDMEFERVDFTNARCSASGVVTPTTFAVEINIMPSRSGTLACSLAPLSSR